MERLSAAEATLIDRDAEIKDLKAVRPRNPPDPLHGPPPPRIPSTDLPYHSPPAHRPRRSSPRAPNPPQEITLLKRQMRDPRGAKASLGPGGAAWDQAERVRALSDEVESLKTANRSLQQQHAHDERAAQLAAERENRLKERLKQLQDSARRPPRRAALSFPPDTPTRP